MDYRTTRTTLVLGIITGLAMALRLFTVWKMGAPPDNDGLEYHSIAIHLLSGLGYIDQHQFTTARSPVYPAFLAVLYALFGIHYQIALIAQAVLQAGMVVPVFFLARAISGSQATGLLAALLFAINPSFEIVSLLYTENLLVILLIFFLWSAYEALRCKVGWLLPAIIAGLCAGGLGLTKPELSLLTPFMLLLCLLWRAVRDRWRQCVIMTTIAMIMVGAWEVRNYNVREHMDRSQLYTLTEAIVFSSVYPAHTGSWWWTVTDMSKLENELARATQYRHKRTLRVLENELREKIKQYPFGYVKLSICRVLILWVSPPVGSSMLGRISPVLKWSALAGQWLFVMLALGMLIRSLKTRPELLPFLVIALYWTGVYSLTGAWRRYGYPLVAEECILAAWGLWLLYSGWHQRRGERLKRRKPSQSQDV